jgi:hypothetical protein
MKRCKCGRELRLRHEMRADLCARCQLLSAAARALRAIPSERRAAASRENGKRGGRPRKETRNV